MSGNFTETYTDAEEYLRILYTNINEMYVRAAELFNKEDAMKVCTLMIGANRKNINHIQRRIESELFHAFFYSLSEHDFWFNDFIADLIGSDNGGCFTPLQQASDTNLLKAIVPKEMTNDDSRYIFTFRYITGIYNAFMIRSVSLQALYTNEIMTSINNVLIRLSTSCNHLKILLNDSEHNTYKTAYDTFLYDVNPIQIYIKERCDTGVKKNPRYDVNYNCDNGMYCNFSIDYYNNPLRVGFYNIKNGRDLSNCKSDTEINFDNIIKRFIHHLSKN